MATTKARIRLMMYDGTRQPFSKRQSLLLRIHDGETIDPVTKILNTKSAPEGVVFIDVDYHDNFADNYTVVLSADGYQDVGYFPVKVSPKVLADLSIMLVPKNPTFEFDPWDVLVSNHLGIAQFLSLTTTFPDAAKNYATSVEDHPKETACLLTLATAMSQIFLANGTPLDYFRSIEWATLAPDRFFGYAVPDLVSEVKAAASKGLFAPEIDPSFFHGDATSSFKEVRFGEANVQLTFHENDKQTIGSDVCIRIEPDIDYYKDLAAHALLEVLYNQITNSLTDPTQVYVLRWIAGKQAGLPEFDPPYKLVE
jgi:hypothetical protein